MAHLIIRELGSERTAPLVDEETTIGRSRRSSIRIIAEQSSRIHCKILKTDEGFKVVDNDSSNGTLVNGTRIKDHPLVQGDEIGVGQAILIFREGDPVARITDEVEARTTGLALHDRSVQILIETIIQAGEMEDSEAFLRLAVDNVVQITNAERGILFTAGEGAELESHVARDGAGKDLEELIGISRSIPKKVWESGEAIYILDTASQKKATQSRSISMYQLRTVMCAPLRVGEKKLGVLYVDSHAKTREYSAADLAIFEGTANYLALTLENLRAAFESRRKQGEERRDLQEENVRLRAALEKRRHLIGECPEMKSLYEMLRKVAPTNASVLLLGESGTGKEAIAQALHDLSPRSQKRLVIIDCAAIPETLLESEIFGYEKGAFTGAVSQKLGKMELADGGTLFLDEVAELSLSLQVKLLRALEQKTLTRVGGIESLKIDARIVAATNRDLETEAREGKFRQDLLFRIQVVTLKLPPLRDRGDDILLLADFFLEEANELNGRNVGGFTEEAREAMRRYKWEGNIRELKHRIEQAVILTNNESLSAEDLNLTGETGVFRSLEGARDHFEKAFIVKNLAQHSNNVTHTAKALGISRQHLQNLLKKHEISKSKGSAK